MGTLLALHPLLLQLRAAQAPAFLLPDDRRTYLMRSVPNAVTGSAPSLKLWYQRLGTVNYLANGGKHKGLGGPDTIRESEDPVCQSISTSFASDRCDVAI